jgi:hypothetical protein
MNTTNLDPIKVLQMKTTTTYYYSPCFGATTHQYTRKIAIADSSCTRCTEHGQVGKINLNIKGHSRPFFTLALVDNSSVFLDPLSANATTRLTPSIKEEDRYKSKFICYIYPTSPVIRISLHAVAGDC